MLTAVGGHLAKASVKPLIGEAESCAAIYWSFCETAGLKLLVQFVLKQTGSGLGNLDSLHPFSKILLPKQPESSWRDCGWEWPVFNPDEAPQYGRPKGRGNSHAGSLLSKPTYFPFRIVWGKKSPSACLRGFKEHSVLILQISDCFMGLQRLCSEGSFHPKQNSSWLSEAARCF